MQPVTAREAPMQDGQEAIRLRSAEPGEAAALSALALRSKAVWGYDAAFLEACRAELTLEPDTIAAGGVTVAERGGRTVGLSRLAIEAGPGGATAEILLLFVEPGLLRGGVGRVLFEAMEREARRQGAARIAAGADPDAEGFYRRMGMTRTGSEPSGSIPGRLLPRLEKSLQD
jgi:GNAT superfamily N-acetyltransferase